MSAIASSFRLRWPVSSSALRARWRRPAVRREVAFQALQLGGWLLYGFSKQLAFPMTALDSLWVAAKGVLLTQLLRSALRRLDAPRIAPLQRALAIAALIVVFAQLSLGLSWLLSYHDLLLRAPGTTSWLFGARAQLQELLLFTAWSALYLGVRHALALERERRALRRALKTARRARLALLRHQLHPHFLFNALTTLRAELYTDSARAARIVGELSGFLRHVLREGQAECVPLQQEFGAIAHYLAIQQMRFEPRLDCRLALDPAVRAVRIPALLLQPLLENAVRFGLLSRPHGTEVRVDARRHGTRCVIEVRNRGHWIESAAISGEPHGLGLRNVRARLREAVRDRFELEFLEAAGWVVVRVVLHDR